MSKLFSPIKVGNFHLSNRIAMAPMTRSRSTGPEYLARPMMRDYYAQRSSAGLIITEGMPVSDHGRANAMTPGLYSEAQVKSWQPVTSAVHKHGGTIFAQIWHVGRATHGSISGGLQPLAPSAIKGAMQAFGPLPEGGYGFLVADMPREMSYADIEAVIEQHVIAAKNAVQAGFDGVEILGANYALIDQFLHHEANKRTDLYGGSVENRIRFAVELVNAVANAIGAGRVGIRLSPHVTMDHPIADPEMPETAIALLKALDPIGIAYVHFSENLLNDLPRSSTFRQRARNAFGGCIMVAGGYSKATAEQELESGLVDMVAFGSPFISNPDLVYRLQNDLPLAEANRDTFYGGNEEGLIDYPALDPNHMSNKQS